MVDCLVQVWGYSHDQGSVDIMEELLTYLREFGMKHACSLSLFLALMVTLGWV